MPLLANGWSLALLCVVFLMMGSKSGEAALLGSMHTCAVTSGGGAVCWGLNSSGQLGDGTTTTRTAPVAVSGLASVIAIAAATHHTCALTGAGGVVCWGDNSAGELGDGTTTNRSTPVAVSGLASGVTAIAAGFDYTCALTSGGSVLCWGVNSDGQLGDGTTTTRTAPVAVIGVASVASITAGIYHACAVTSGGGAVCWGSNSSGQLGDGTTTSRSTAAGVSGLPGVTAITAGGFHTCALTTVGDVTCWGDNSNGQLGDGTLTNRTAPVAVAGLASVTAIAAGSSHTCALTSGGGAMCWGSNAYGQLGSGPLTGSSTPVGVNGLANGVTTAITAGGFHTCALASSETIRCWGLNNDGQLGDGGNWYGSTPGAVSGLAGGVTTIATGYHTCAVTSTGGVSCWGYNRAGELGDGTTTDRSMPVAVSGLSSGATAIAVGVAFTCAVTTGHVALCWGDNTLGQLGDGTTTTRSTPVAVSGLVNVTAVAARNDHTCALTSGGGVLCWGDNALGQLGDGTTTNRSTPVAVSLLATVTAIAAGASHTCALSSGGGVFCWGANVDGELGDGTTTTRTTPVAVSGLASGVAAIAAAGTHTCALTGGGTVKCWGFNGEGQLGDGTTTSRSTPVAVSGLASVTAIAAGNDHSCALTNGGSVSCWGDNSAGELGDGTTTTRLTPVTVSGLASVSALAAGVFNTCAITLGGGAFCWGGNEYGQLGNGTAGYSVDSVGVLLPALTTLPASAISLNTASVGASVSADGGVPITARGVCWSTTANPTLASSCSSNGTGIGSFTAFLTGLSPRTLYHARAYVTNAQGTFFAVEVTFTSIPTMTVDRVALTFAAVSNGTAFTAATAPQMVRLTESGGGTVTWTAASNQPWLVVSPASGTGTATLTVSTQFTAGLIATQSGSITITLTGAGNAVGPINATLQVRAASSPPFGSFDTPTNGVAGVAGSIAVTGWALDAVQVMRVTVCRDAVTGETPPVDPNCAGNAQVYVGDAVFIDGARPDVQGLYSTMPLSSRAGWGYLLLTNFLPNLGNGTFTLRAYAFDAAGLTTALGVKTITCDNADSVAPFGAIDVPGQGAVTSGVVGNTGWVLARAPNFADPPHGGVVNVFVDGNTVGSPGLWNARPDLTALFPVLQYPGIATALGIFGLDTTTLTDGVHTIFWLATGSGPSGTSGIGSRFFTVLNGSELVDQSPAPSVQASAPSGTVIAARSTLDFPPGATSRIASAQTLAADIAAATLDLRTIQGRRGYDLNVALRGYSPSSGAIDVQAEELDRIELHLTEPGHQQYTGYLQTAGGLRPLPVGSSLDAATATFTWMPGVGFYGTYHLTFVRWSGANAVARQDVRITLNAKGSNRIGPQTIIDAPKSGATAGSPFFVGGWAADLDSTVDTGVNTVHVWAYPIDARGNRLDPIFIGPAIYGGARPDVASVYGERFGDSGYGIIVNGLAPGTYDIAVFAYSTVVNTFTPATVVRVTVR
jgi:alpha-tubulin suppressor-like RCC1 family protein